MNYHVGRGTQQLGVHSEETIREMLAKGELRPDDLGWCEGMTDWRPLGALFPSTTPPPMVTSPAAPLHRVQPGRRSIPPKPNNNLVPAILVTLFCCLPFGIISIIFAAQVDGKYSAGDYAGAAESARKSRLWMWWSLGVGVVAAAIYFFLGMASAVSAV